MNNLHGLTGSIATSLFTKIRGEYHAKNKEDDTKFIFTNSSLNIIDMGQLWLDHESWFTDEHEWEEYKYGKKVLHIELIKWADRFIIAPCSANTLAKLANGICDNLLTCCARAWDFNKPFIIAPAMNTNMWNHPITQKHLDTLRSWGIIIKDPISKTLYCGDTGMGAMANIYDIINP